MYLTEDFPFISPFRFAGNRSPAKNLDLLSRRFDSALLSRLTDLTTNPSLLSFDWLAIALDLLSKTHSDAHNIVAAHLRFDDDDPLGAYLEDSLKLLDLCNFIASEIERLRHRRLLLRFSLHLLTETPSPAIVRAKKSLSEWIASSSSSTVSTNDKNLESRTVLIREMARSLQDPPPRGRISTVGKLIRRTIYAVQAVAVFVAGAVIAALTGTAPAAMVKVPSEFAWADTFNGLVVAVSGEFAKRFCGRDLERLESRVKGVYEVIDDDGDGTGGDGVVIVRGTERMEKLKREVTELKTVTEAFSDGLDRLFNGGDELFRAVLWTRNGVLEKYRMGPQKKIRKLSCK